MNARTIVIVVCIATLFLSAGTGVAGANHNDDLFDWIEDTAGVNDDGTSDYGIDDPYSLFSSDSETLGSDPSQEDYNQHFNDESDLKDFYEAGDYTSESPQEAVRQWNSRNRREFNPGGRSKSIMPEHRREDVSNSESGHIRDAHVTFFSIDPSTEVHKEPTGDETDTTVYRIAPSSDVNVVSDARVEAVPEGILSRILGNGIGMTLEEYAARPDKAKDVSIEEFEMAEMRLYTSGCHHRSRCLVDSTTTGARNGQVVKFEDPGLNAGGQTLTVEATYETKVEIQLYDRDVDCDGDISIDWENQDVNAHADCEWTDWETEEIEIITDSHTVSHERYVVVEQPEVKAMKANLPGDREEYYLYDLDKAEWSKIAWGANGEEDVGVRSAWRFFSARDQNWDMYCEKDGLRRTAGMGKCTTGGDARHTESTARPLLTHAIPGPNNITKVGQQSRIRDTTTYELHPYPNAEAHSTCQSTEYNSGGRGRYGSVEETNSCPWRFAMYEGFNKDESSYREADGLVVQRFTESEYVRAYGLVEGNANDVEITDERDVRLAKMSYKQIEDGRDISDAERAARANTDGVEAPDEDEVLMRVSIWDAQTKEGIDLTERTGEYLIVSNGNHTYIVRPGPDGTAYLNVKRSDRNYRITYRHWNWWNAPEDEQAYVTEGDLYANADGFEGNPWLILYQVALVLGVPFVVLKLFASVLGIDLRKEHLLWLFKGK